MKDNFRDRLQLIMQDRMLKQNDILKLCEPYSIKSGVQVRKNDISQYLSGVSVPKYDKIYVLSLALGVSEAWLMGYDDSPQKGKITIHSANNEEVFSIVSDLLRLDCKDFAVIKECVGAMLRQDKYSSR